MKMPQIDLSKSSKLILMAIGFNTIATTSTIWWGVHNLEKSLLGERTRKPASYFPAYSNSNQFELELEVMEISRTSPSHSDVKPPLNGYVGFSKTPDDVFFYVFTKDPVLKEGDKMKGWFNSTDLLIEGYAVILPIVGSCIFRDKPSSVINAP